MTHDEQLITWLNNAYAMERALEQVLANHAKDASSHPDMSARINEHLEETREHADKVAECLALFEQQPSTLKSAVGTVLGALQGSSTGMFHDELMKNALADYAAEHFEIACYTALIAAAEEAGQDRIVEICGEILEDEEDMADWLREQIPATTRMALEHAGT